MADYNRVILVGRLTRDPQLSYTPSNTAVVQFGLATGRKWKGQDGQEHEETCFVDCDLFGRGAEVFNQYMTKGREVLIEGRLKFRQWETPEGQKRSKLSVAVEAFKFMGQRTDGAPRSESAGARPAGPPAGRPPVQRQATPRQASSGSAEEPPPPSYDDEPPPGEADVPF
jgi:single-strand DNA-binding protein